MRIGILGSGLMGGKLGTLLARAGHEVVFSYARSQAKLKRLAQIAGGNALAGMPAQAARGADALLLPHSLPRCAATAGDISGKVIVSCSLPMNADNTELVVAHTSSGLEELAKIVPKAQSCRRIQQRAQRGPFQRLRRAAPSQKAEPSVLWRRQARQVRGRHPDP